MQKIYRIRFDDREIVLTNPGLTEMVEAQRTLLEYQTEHGQTPSSNSAWNSLDRMYNEKIETYAPPKRLTTKKLLNRKA